MRSFDVDFYCAETWLLRRCHPRDEIGHLIETEVLGTRARTPTLGFLGWFGPRGLASIVFALIVIEESNLPHEHLIVLAIYLTVGLSVFAHGLSAAPLANRYARWYQQHPRGKPPPMESAPTEVTRARGPAQPTEVAT